MFPFFAIVFDFVIQADDGVYKCYRGCHGPNYLCIGADINPI